jgi:outer membrane receptor protein involved in Fe transport
VNSNIDFDQNRPDPTMFFLDAGILNTRINNRGLLGSALTDFFRSVMPVDAYNTGRFDFASGPNSVLFGVANSAGSINTSTLQAVTQRNHLKLQAQMGSWSSYRGSVDANVVVVPDRVAVRLMGMHQQREDWRHWNDRKDDRFTASLRIIPSKRTRTNLVASFERADLWSNWAQPMNLGDSVSFWETLPDSVRLIDNRGALLSNNAAAARGLIRITSGRLMVVNNTGEAFGNTINPTTGGMTMYESASFYETAAQFDTLIGVVPGWQPRIFRDTFETLLPATAADAAANRPFQSTTIAPYKIGSGPDSTRGSTVKRLFVRVEQPIGRNLFLDLSYQNEKASGQSMRLKSSLLADPNLYIPDGAGGAKPNPNVGRYYLEGTPGSTINTEDNEALRFSALYNLDLGRFGDHRILGMWESSETTTSQLGANMALINTRTNQPILNPNVRNGNNQVVYRTYVTPGVDNYRDWHLGHFGSADPIRHGGIDYRKYFPFNFSGLLAETDTYVVATQSSFFNKRLLASAGYRRDRYKSSTGLVETLTASHPQVQSGRMYTGDILFTGEYGAPNEETFNTYTAGLVWHINSTFSVFANQATNVSPAQTNRFVIPNDFQVPDPVEGKGHDMGAMIRLMENRFSARLTYFSGENPGNPVNRLNSVANYHDQILSALATSINPATGQTYLTAGRASELFVHPKQGRNYNSALVDGLSDDKTTGFEMDVKFNPSRNWTLTAAFSRTKLERDNIFTEFDGWFTDVRPYLAQFGNPDGLRDERGVVIDIATNLERMQLEVEDLRNAGTFGFNNRPLKANFFTRYGFSEGKLKGLFVGGGVRWQSKNRVQRQVTGLTPDNRAIYGPTLHGPEIFNVDALIGYSGRTDLFGRRTNWRVQLNGYNVFDDDTVQILRYSADGSRLWRVAPRPPANYRLTFSVDL